VTNVSTPINACWNSIGVRGDRSCAELEKHVHCRNCPVYSAAAVDLLDRPVSKEYLQHWTAHLARTERENQHRGTQSVLVFRLGAEWLAASTGLFKEVVGSRPVHALPDRRHGLVLGLVSIRGELVVCISLFQLLGLEQAETRRSGKQRIGGGRLLTIEDQGLRTAFPADEVHGTLRFNPDDLRQAPATVAGAAATYIKALLPWQEQTIGMLDEPLLIAALNRSLPLATT
jgi:chemotaxis-related protein WspD